ncbi:MAG: hypothetical protein JWP29_5157 [Rhodoferax sp.]|nr:hypothetical protein [Rhodoferax sp.]
MQTHKIPATTVANCRGGGQATVSRHILADTNGLQLPATCTC